METKAVIFDFNGTLFWDTPLHDKAWDLFLLDHHISFTKQDKMEKIHGKPNQDILRYIFGPGLSDTEVNRMIEQKEQIYRQICLESEMEFAPGALEFIQYLSQKSISYSIATSSGWENVSFYIEQMNLARWFDLEKLVYNDGSFRGKPQPDIFLKAFNLLDILPEQALIFEDAPIGIQAARNSGAGKIIIVNSNDNNYSEFKYPVISDFREASGYL
ncbi:MAG: HAD family phosphatase [Bacteroidales bacterium]